MLSLALLYKNLRCTIDKFALLLPAATPTLPLKIVRVIISMAMKIEDTNIDDTLIYEK